MYNKKGQVLILWNLKPSVVRLVTGVMEVTGTPFKYCTKVWELEEMIDDAVVEKDKGLEFKSLGIESKVFEE
jgi:hypothetical protein